MCSTKKDMKRTIIIIKKNPASARNKNWSAIRDITTDPWLPHVLWLKFTMRIWTGSIIVSCVLNPCLITASGDRCKIDCPEDAGSSGYFLRTRRFDPTYLSRVTWSHIRLTEDLQSLLWWTLGYNAPPHCHLFIIEVQFSLSVSVSSPLH